MLKLTNKSFDWIFFKKALKILVPIVLSQIIVVAISFVDGIMVNGYNNTDIPSQFSKIDYAAVGVSGELWFAFQAFYSATMVIFSILYSQFSHNKKVFTDTAKFNFWFSMGITLSVSLVMYLFAEPLVNMFFLSKAGPEVAYIKPIAIDYFKIMALGHVFISLAWAILNPLTIKGKTQYALYLSLISLIINFILDYLFIYKADMGAVGSAWATIIAYGIEFIVAVYFAWKHREWFVGFSKLFKLNKFITKEIFKRGLIFITFIGMQLGFVVATVFYSNLYGSSVVKPMAVGYTVSSIMFTVFAGVNRGVKVFIGPLLGQGKFEEAKICSKKLLLPNLFLSSSFTVIALISTTFFPDMMLTNEKDISIAKNMIYIYSSVLVLFVITAYYSAIIETSGFQLLPNVLNYFFQPLIIVPSIFVFSHYGFDLSFTGNFLASQLLFLIPTLIFYIDYKRNKWLRRIEEY